MLSCAESRSENHAKLSHIVNFQINRSHNFEVKKNLSEKKKKKEERKKMKEGTRVASNER